MATCKDSLHFEAGVAFMYSETDCCGTIEECKEKHANDEACGLFKSATDDVPREEVEAIFAEIDSIIELVCAMTGVNITIFGKYAELKKKYVGDKRCCSVTKRN